MTLKFDSVPRLLRYMCVQDVSKLSAAVHIVVVLPKKTKHVKKNLATIMPKQYCPCYRGQ